MKEFVGLVSKEKRHIVALMNNVPQMESIESHFYEDGKEVAECEIAWVTSSLIGTRSYTSTSDIKLSGPGTECKYVFHVRYQ